MTQPCKQSVHFILTYHPVTHPLDTLLTHPLNTPSLNTLSHIHPPHGYTLSTSFASMDRRVHHSR